jgi:hypothetical protein
MRNALEEVMTRVPLEYSKLTLPNSKLVTSCAEDVILPDVTLVDEIQHLNPEGVLGVFD